MGYDQTRLIHRCTGRDVLLADVAGEAFRRILV
jgi:hypothetical protein